MSNEASEVERVENSELEPPIQIVVPPVASTNNVENAEENGEKQTKKRVTKGKKITPWRLDKKFDEVLVKLVLVLKPHKKFRGKMLLRLLYLLYILTFFFRVGIPKDLQWDVFAQKLMDTPEFQSLKLLPEYAGWTINGRSVEAHFKALKTAVVMELGVNTPHTANLSDKEGDLDVVRSSIKMICFEEDEEDQVKKDDVDAAQVLDKEARVALAKKKRTFVDLDGDAVNHKGKKKTIMLDLYYDNYYLIR